MGRYKYGGDTVVIIGSAVQAGVTANVYNAYTGGTQVTDLQNMANGAISQVISDAQGRFLFQGPNNYVQTLWLDFGTGDRWAVRPTDTDQVVALASMTQEANEATSPQHTAKAGIAYPAASYLSSPNLDQLVANTLDSLVIPKYASTAARDAANPAPTNGDTCFVTGTGLMTYDGTATKWFPIGQRNWSVYSSLSALTTAQPAPNDGDTAYLSNLHSEVQWSAGQSAWMGATGTVLLDTTISATTSVTFLNLPTQFTALMILGHNISFSAASAILRTIYNNDAGNNYSDSQIAQVDNTVTAVGGNNFAVGNSGYLGTASATASTPRYSVEWMCYNVADSNPKLIRSIFGGFIPAGGGKVICTTTNGYNTSTNLSQVKFFPSSGTFSGRFRVLGVS